MILGRADDHVIVLLVSVLRSPGVRRGGTSISSRTPHALSGRCRSRYAKIEKVAVQVEPSRRSRVQRVLGWEWSLRTGIRVSSRRCGGLVAGARENRSIRGSSQSRV